MIDPNLIIDWGIKNLAQAKLASLIATIEHATRDYTIRRGNTVSLKTGKYISGTVVKVANRRAIIQWGHARKSHALNMLDKHF